MRRRENTLKPCKPILTQNQIALLLELTIGQSSVAYVVCRFKSMLSDKKFSSRSAVDMRGRSLNLSKKNDLKDLYELESEESSSNTVSDDGDEEEIKIDLARGNGNISSSDSSDGEWDLDEVVVATLLRASAICN